MRRAWLVCLLTTLPAIASADDTADRAAAEAKCLARDPTCDWLATLSSLERQTAAQALKARGLTLEPAPWGKVIAKVHVYNADVFSDDDAPRLRIFNKVHITTRERTIAALLIVQPGDVWEQDRIDETARAHLRDPLYTSVVVIVPVVSKDPGKVDMLVVTRDIWSLRLNTQYTLQEGSLTNLSIALSENNFLGLRDTVALGFTMGLGEVDTGPIFIDKNVLNEKLSLSGRFDVVLNRNDLVGPLCQPGSTECFASSEDKRSITYEGTQSSISLSRPLWSLADNWGAGVSFSHRYAINRRFFGLDLLPVDCSSGKCQIPTDAQGNFRSPLDLTRDTASTTILGEEYQMRQWALSASAVRQWGDSLKHQVTIGYSVADVKPSPLGSFPGNAVERAAFIHDVLPRREFASAPFISYGVFQPTFRTLRNIGTYELAEDNRFGPSADVTATFGLQALGSDANFQRLTLGGSWSFPWCRDGSVIPSASVSIRHQEGLLDSTNYVDNTASAALRFVTPTVRWARLVSSTTVATRWNDTQNSDLVLGGDPTLRGFFGGQFRGQRLLLSQLELRTAPLKIWVTRAGAVLFYELGDAAETFKLMRLHSDVGLGVRVLIPQTTRDVFRFDLAFPLDSAGPIRAGSPHFIGSFEQAF